MNLAVQIQWFQIKDNYFLLSPYVQRLHSYTLTHKHTIHTYRRTYIRNFLKIEFSTLIKCVAKAKFYIKQFTDSKFSELKFKVKLINQSLYQWQSKANLSRTVNLLINQSFLLRFPKLKLLITQYFTNAKLSGAEKSNFLEQNWKL